MPLDIKSADGTSLSKYHSMFENINNKLVSVTISYDEAINTLDDCVTKFGTNLFGQMVAYQIIYAYKINSQTYPKLTIAPIFISMSNKHDFETAIRSSSNMICFVQPEPDTTFSIKYSESIELILNHPVIINELVTASTFNKSLFDKDTNKSFNPKVHPLTSMLIKDLSKKNKSYLLTPHYATRFMHVLERLFWQNNLVV